MLITKKKAGDRPTFFLMFDFLFFTEAQVTGITQTRDDVGVAVEFGIHGCAPECGGILREHLAYIVNAGLSSDD